jgi:GAF domain-containing protein
MSEPCIPLVKLHDLQNFLVAESLEDSLDRQAAMAAGLVGASSCSVMLLNTGEGQEMRMSIYARYGDLPEAAASASIASGEGIAGHVLASGQSLLVTDLGNSAFASHARRGQQAAGSLMCAPIRIDGKFVGVVNAATEPPQAPFGEAALRLLEVVALFMGKSIQVQQLQRLLDSRFAQLALLQEARHKVEHSVSTAYRNPEDVARILARSFFREMTKAGFESAQIVGAASELIEQLNRRLQSNKHDETQNEA